MNNKRRFHQKKSKQLAILRHLLNGDTINSVEAFRFFNTTRLSSSIKSLRNMGYKITTYFEGNSKLGNYIMVSGNLTDNKDLYKSRCR